MKHDSGGPVRPRSDTFGICDSGETHWHKYYGQAMQGLITAWGKSKWEGDLLPGIAPAPLSVVPIAADYADAMIAEMREREKRA